MVKNRSIRGKKGQILSDFWTFLLKKSDFCKKSLALVQILDYNAPVTNKGHNLNNINQTDTAMITYIVTSTTESYQYNDGHVDSVIERGTAATLAAAKRKARKAAAEHGHHAEISYEEDGKYVLREVNTYGIEGDWVEVN